MTTPQTFIARYRVAPEHFEEFRDLAQRYRDTVESDEPDCLMLGLHFDELRFTHIAVHADRDAVERHLPLIGSFIERAAELAEIDSIEVYGEPGPRLAAAIEANVAAGASAEVFAEPGIGFARAA
jgi:quinol monooxygenase YgiN